MATGATGGFLYVPGMTGAPASATGPTGYTGTVAHVFDVSNNMPWYLNPVNTFAGSTGATPSWVAGNGQVLIQRIILGGATGTVTFNNIPQVFTQLRAIYLTRVDGAIGLTNTSMRFNGDSGPNYNVSVVDGGGVAGSTAAFAQTSILYLGFGCGTTIASYPATGVVDIPFYNTTFFKTVTGTSGCATATNGSTYTRNMAGAWANTSPITSITFLPIISTGNFIAGCIFTLYGVW